jgi:hypothetical protein
MDNKDLEHMNAKQARTAALTAKPLVVETELDTVLNLVIYAANNGRNSVQVRSHIWKPVQKRLKALGYKVTVGFKADIISW